MQIYIWFQIFNLQNIHQMFNNQFFIIARLVAVNGWFLYEYFVKKTKKILSAYFADELLQVKTVDNKLLVHAKHEESGGGKGIFVHFCLKEKNYLRPFLLPQVIIGSKVLLTQTKVCC